jgi:hypothetical protein
VLASAAAPTFFDEITIDIEFDEKRRPIAEGLLRRWRRQRQQQSQHATVHAGAGAFLQIRLEVGRRQSDDDVVRHRRATAERGWQERSKGCRRDLRGVHALRAMVYDTQMQGIMMMQALSEPKRAVARQFRDRRHARRVH